MNPHSCPCSQPMLVLTGSPVPFKHMPLVPGLYSAKSTGSAVSCRGVWCCPRPPSPLPSPLWVASPLPRLQRGREHAGRKGLSLESWRPACAYLVPSREPPWGPLAGEGQAATGRHSVLGKKTPAWAEGLGTVGAGVQGRKGSCFKDGLVTFEYLRFLPRSLCTKPCFPGSAIQPASCLLAHLSECSKGAGDERLPGLRSQLSHWWVP